MARIPDADHVTGMRSHAFAPAQVSDDGRVVYDVVTLDLDPDRSPDALEPVAAALTEVPGVRTSMAGGPAFYGDIQHVSEQDLQRSELISLPLAGLALLLVFGSVVAAGVPIVTGGMAVLVALAALFIAASLTPMSIFVLNLATLLGFGLGVDYALLLASRFREELAARGGGRTADGNVDQAVVADAVAATVTTAGRAVFFSGITVLLGLSGLVLFDFMVLRSVGIAGALVVAFAVAAALTLLPAGLAILGPRIDAFPVRLRRRRTSAAAPPPSSAPAAMSGAAHPMGFWGRLAERVMDRPVAVFVPTLLFLVILGLPFLHVRFNAPDASILPPDVPSRQAYDTLLASFGEGDFGPLILAVRTAGDVTDPDNIGRLHDYTRQLAADPRVKRVDSIVDLDPRLGREQ